MKRGLAVLFLFTITFIFLSINVSAANVVACGTLNSANTVYDLQNNVSSSLVCFTISAQNITLDGHGYTIFGDRSSQGVYVTAAANGTTVKNLNIYNVTYGIYLPSGSNHQVLNNSINNITQIGIYIPTGVNSVIANNTILLTSNNGIYLPSTANISVMNNVITSAGSDGIYNPSTSNNQFINNTVRFSTGDGIQSPSSKNVTLLNNTFTNNTRYGIYISSSPNSTIKFNVANYNAFDGMRLLSSRNITLINNTAAYNIIHGVSIANVNNSIFMNNSLLNNTLSGMSINFTGADIIAYNTISGNSQGIFMRSSADHLFVGNTITNNAQIGINLTLATNITFTNSSITSSGVTLNDLFIGDSNDTQFVDGIVMGNYSFLNSTFSFENRTYGRLQLLTLRTTSGVNFTTGLAFDGNYLFFNTSNNLLNTSANISLYGTPGVGKTNHIVTRDGSRCTDCYVYTSLSETIVIFNTTTGGAYSIANGPTPTSSSPSSGGSSNRGSSHGGSSSGSSTTKPTAQTYALTSTVLEQGSSNTLKEGDILTFEAGSTTIETHSLTIDNINTDTVDITVQSVPQKITLMQGATENIDLDGDDIDDLLIDCTSITQDTTTLTLTTLQAPTEVPETLPMTEPDTIQEPTRFPTNYIIIGIVLVVGIIVAILLIRRRK